MPQIERVSQAIMQVYGAEKVWRQLASETGGEGRGACNALQG